MHLTYRDLSPHIAAASPSDSGEAGAPGSFYGNICVEPPYGTVTAVNPLREALERTYYDWWAENCHALDMGLPGDVLDLRQRLNAAFAKFSNCALVAPREARNAPIEISKSIT